MDEKDGHVWPEIPKTGSSIVECSLSRADQSAATVDDLEAGYDFGCGAVARRAHEERPIGQAASNGSAMAGKSAEKR